MPIENRTRTTTTTTTKPLTPTLSSNLRSRPAYAVTPRLAGAGPTSPVSALQRNLRQQTLPFEKYDEDRTVLQNVNITPRSGAKGTRIDTESPSTPDNAAHVQRLMAEEQEEASTPNNGLGIITPTQTPVQTRPKSTDQLSFLPTAGGRRISGSSNASSVKDESKFFRADDVKSTPVARVNGSRPKTSYFPPAPSPRVSPRKALTQNKDKPEDKFVYANHMMNHNGTRNAKPSLAAKLTTTSPAAASSTRSLPALLSTTSPSVTRSLHSKKTSNTSQPSPSSATPQSGRLRSSSTTQSNTNSVRDRRRSSSLSVQPASIDMGKTHRKSLSTSSTSVSAAPKSVTQANTKDLADKSRPRLDKLEPTQTAVANPSLSPSTPRSTSITSAHTADTSLTSNHSVLEIHPKRPPFQPRHMRGSSETTAIQPVTKEQIEAAANARRERKVLDLEISNSSLLAINKTLEKELRKQNAELRRFRRLSRSGRLSLTPSNRMVSGASMSTLTTLDEVDDDSNQFTMSPTTSDPGSPDEEDDFPSDDDSNFTESSDVMRRRARDEKRLIQDLQRHQQILIDSQKLTQSIQRCLNCTEELIKDGNKALTYQVEDTEVQLGGRVLNQDDDEALSEVDFDEYTESMVKPRQGLLSPSITKDVLEVAAMWANGLQSLDGQKDHAPNHIFDDQPTIESPSPTLELSPVILPER